MGGSHHSASATSAPPTVSKMNVATVIPPTTIVCLPSAVSTPSFINHTQLSSCLNAPSSSSVVSSSLTKTAAVASSSAVPYLALSSNTPVRALPTQLPKSQAKAKPRDPSQVNYFVYCFMWLGKQYIKIMLLPYHCHDKCKTCILVRNLG